VAGSSAECNNVGVDVGDSVGKYVCDNYGGVINADDSGFNGGQLRGRQRRMTTTVKKRCNNQIDYNKDNKGRLKELGGYIQGWWDALLSVIRWRQIRWR
jgi:hypothetical protein